MATALDEFTTVMQSTGNAWVRGTENIRNEAVRRRYTWSRFITGKSPVEMAQGGAQIQDRIYFDENSTWLRYDPQDDFSYDNPQTGVNWTVDWAFAKADVTWTKHEPGLNQEHLTGDYRVQVFKKVMWQKMQNLWTSVCNAIDDEFWATPNNDLMESSSPSGPKVPFSIPVYVNEETNGLPTANTDDNGTLWTTVMGIAPATYGKWVPEQRVGTTNGYTFNGGATINVVSDLTNLFERMSYLMTRTTFDRLPMHEEYTDKRSSPNCIFTQLQGVINFESACRIGQDQFRGHVGKTSGQDPDYEGATFRGVPIEYIEALDTALLYNAGNSGAPVAFDDTDSSFISGPRYYGINGLAMNMVAHEDNFLVPDGDVIRPSARPFSRTQIYDVWNNFICRSRRAHWITSPATDVTNV